MTILTAFLATLNTTPPDVTPNAIAWDNMSGDITATGAAETFAGIDSEIAVSWSFSGTGTPVISAKVNAGSNETSPVDITNGDTLSFFASASGAVSGTVTVVNDTDGGATLDTFSLSMTGSIEP